MRDNTFIILHAKMVSLANERLLTLPRHRIWPIIQNPKAGRTRHMIQLLRFNKGAWCIRLYDHLRTFIPEHALSRHQRPVHRSGPLVWFVLGHLTVHRLRVVKIRDERLLGVVSGHCVLEGELLIATLVLHLPCLASLGPGHTRFEVARKAGWCRGIDGRSIRVFI
jgi:hypothetical protein